MSAKATFWAWEQNITGNNKLVLLCYAQFANDDDRAWPGKGTVAKKCGISLPTVKRTVRWLIENGYLQDSGVGVTETADNKRRETSCYKLLIRINPDQDEPGSRDQTPLNPVQNEPGSKDGEHVNPDQFEPGSDSTGFNLNPVQNEPGSNESSSRVTVTPNTINNKPINTPTKKKNKTSNSKPRAQIFPDDFAITGDMFTWAIRKGLTIDLDKATEQWINSMKAKGEARVDWVAAWRNGMIFAQDWRDERLAQHGVPKTPLPIPWDPSEEAISFAYGLIIRENKVDRVSIDLELRVFREHHQAHGTLCADWDAAYRKWMINAVQMR